MLAIAAGVRGAASPRWILVLEGIVGVLTGFLAFILPNFVAVALLYIIAAWAIFTGILEIRLRREIRGEWALALGGVLSVILGVILAVLPGVGLLSLVWLVGIYAT